MTLKVSLQLQLQILNIISTLIEKHDNIENEYNYIYSGILMSELYVFSILSIPQGLSTCLGTMA